MFLLESVGKVLWKIFLDDLAEGDSGSEITGFDVLGQSGKE